VPFAATRREHPVTVAARLAFSLKTSALVSCSASRRTAHASRVLHPGHSAKWCLWAATFFVARS